MNLTKGQVEFLKEVEARDYDDASIPEDLWGRLSRDYFAGIVNFDQLIEIVQMHKDDLEALRDRNATR